MKLLLTFLLTGLSICGICQDTMRTYFDAFWRATVEEDASYYRKMYKNAQNLWVVNDYYLDGQLQMQGQFSNPKTEKKTGHFTYFYPNGAKQSEGEYTEGYKSGHWRSWFTSKALDGEGDYLRDKKTGTWVWYHKNGQISARETYSYDKLKEFEYFDEAGVKSTVSSIDANTMPEFPGGVKEYLKWIQTAVSYPETARIRGLSGIVNVSFTVKKDGSIADVTVENPVHPLLHAEAIRVIKSMPNWRPGKDHNRSFEIIEKAPIQFKLE